MGCGSCASARWMMFIGSVQTAIGEAVDKVMQAAKEQGLLKEHHTGGYFCLKMIGANDFLIKPWLVGKSNGQDKTYIEFCQEKANRLEAEYLASAKFSEYPPKYPVVSSWQSRDTENKKWGGAILGSDNQGRQYAFSFSGLPELCDEAATLLTAIKVGHLSANDALEIAKISGSYDLLLACGDYDGIIDDGSDR